MNKFLLLCVLGVAGLWSPVSQAVGPEFSADVVAINLKDQTEHAIGKLYVSNFRQRKEMAVPDKRATEEYGQTVVQIVNPQRQAMWQVFPDKHKYWEWTGKIPTEQAPLPGDSHHFCAQGKGISCSKLTTEPLGSRMADKWELSVTKDGKKNMQSLVWIDPKLGMPIREEVPGVGAMELRNIKEGTQPDSLFEIPTGFQKTEPPQGHVPGGSQVPQGGVAPQGMAPR
ncbi:conserved exported hypothetical protein [Gammaproteobacteria bacterium]